MIRIEAFALISPGSSGVAVKWLLRGIEGRFGDQVQIVFRTGSGEEEWRAYVISSPPAP